MTLQARSARNAQIKIPFKVLHDYLPAKLVTTWQRLEIRTLKNVETDDTPAQVLREKEKSKQCKRNKPQPNRSLTRVILTATDLVLSLYRKPSDSQTAALVNGSL